MPEFYHLHFFFRGHNYPTFLVGSAEGSLAQVFTNQLARPDVRQVRNLAMVPGHPFNIHMRDHTHIDESPCLQNTGLTVSS